MMTRRIEMRGLLLAASAAFALGATVAQAADIGDVLKFRAPIVGCTDFSDAREALRLRTLQGAYTAESFALSIGVEREGRQCTVFGKPWRGKPDDSEWRIVQKQQTQYTGPSEAWFCVETMTPFDVRDPKETEKAPPPALPCFWVFMSKTPSGRY
jgi:hypothetical protein